MPNIKVLFAGAAVTFSIAFIALILLPGLQISQIPPSPGIRPYSESELRGRETYMQLGCIYCHTQQVRAPEAGADVAWGWGRPSVPGDYVYDYPHLLGTMRTGPDLSNIGARQSSDAWHYLHLYNPRAVVAWSIMPSYPFLFEHKDQADPNDTVVTVPADFNPSNKVVVATERAKDLVAYLISLNRNAPLVQEEE